MTEMPRIQGKHVWIQPSFLSHVWSALENCQIGQIGQIWLQIGQIGQIWLQIGQIWLRICQIGQICQIGELIGQIEQTPVK